MDKVEVLKGVGGINQLGLFVSDRNWELQSGGGEKKGAAICIFFLYVSNTICRYGFYFIERQRDTGRFMEGFALLCRRR